MRVNVQLMGTAEEIYGKLKLLECIQLRNKPEALRILEGFFPKEEGEDGIALETIDLSVRTYNALRRRGIVCVEDIFSQRCGKIKRIRNLGEVSWKELIAVLRQFSGDEKVDEWLARG